MRPLTREWVEKAEEDHLAAESLWGGSHSLYNSVCFHAQQCVEKYLKAWLTEQQTSFPRTHDLEILARLAAPTLPTITALLNDLRFVTSFAVEARYPGTSALHSDAQRSRRLAGAVRTTVRQQLGI